MRKTSRRSGILQSQMKPIARRIRNRMKDLNLTELELASKCNEATESLASSEERPIISRERIAKILMNCKRDAKKSAARALGSIEIKALALALQVSMEWLIGVGENSDLILWDPLASPQRAEQIIHLMNTHEENSNDTLVWAEYLMCSFEPPEFMHEHHQALFRELDLIGLAKEKQKVVQIYDRIGNLRRKHLLNTNIRRNKDFTQIILLSDLERIVRGADEYHHINKDLRKSCIKNIGKLISNESLKINLVVIQDTDAQPFKPALHDYDSVGVFGDGLVLWRYHSGRIAWSEHPAHIKPYRNMLKELQKRSIYHKRQDVLNLLSELSTSIR
jgi:hypothetical protein